MRRATSLLAAGIVVVFAASLLAQAKPSFAGKWTVVVDPNAPAPAAGARGGRGGRGGMGLGQEFTAAQDEKTLTVTSMNQAGEVKRVYNLDGSASTNTLSLGAQSIDQVSKVKWDGAKLVITTTTNFNGNANESTQSWSLEASGNLIVESTSSFGGQGPTTTKTTYKKG